MIISAEETANRPEEIERFGFTEKLHGLVAFSPSGEAVVTLPGHDYGKVEIEAALQTVLAGQ